MKRKLLLEQAVEEEAVAVMAEEAHPGGAITFKHRDRRVEWATLQEEVVESGGKGESNNALILKRRIN